MGISVYKIINQYLLKQKIKKCNKNTCLVMCLQVFLCGVCRSFSRRRLGGSSHQRRPLELLYVWVPEHLRVTAAKGRLALQTTALLCQQPWTGIRKSLYSLYIIHIKLYVYKYKSLLEMSSQQFICIWLHQFSYDLHKHRQNLPKYWVQSVSLEH